MNDRLAPSLLARRRLLGLGSAAAATAALAACGSSGTTTASSTPGGSTATGGASTTATGGSEAVTLTMWDWVDSSKAIALFEKSHPTIKVKLDLVAAGAPTYAKMFAAIKAGNAPDVGLIELNTLPQFAASGGLADLSKYGASSVESQFLPWAWKQVSLGGGVYALPLSASPIGYHYNQTLLSKYGINTIPTTYAELAAAATLYHQRNPKGYLVDVPPSANYLALLTWQAGGSWFTAKGDTWHLGFTSAASHQVADYLQGLVDAKDVFTEMSFLAPWYQALSGGQLASFVGPQWSDALLASQVGSQAGNFKVATAPQWVAGHQVDGQEGGGSLAVFKSSKNPQAAYTFVNWMLTDPAAQSLNFQSGYGWPTTVAGAKLPALSAPNPYYKGQVTDSIYQASNNATNQDWQWGPNYGTVSTDLNGYLADALSGKMTIWQALQKEEATELAELKSQGISAVGGS